jgi:pentapeptide MXKDX repeat protein
LEKEDWRATIPPDPGKAHLAHSGVGVYNNQTKEQQSMKKVLAVMFALALSVSMSSFAFGQAAGGDKPADKSDKMAKTDAKKDKKDAKKKAKAEKKDEMKKDDMKKDEMKK